MVSPFLISALSQGIINLTSLSRIIKSEIEISLKKQVKYGAIVMALKRLSSELEFRTTHKIVKIIKLNGQSFCSLGNKWRGDERTFKVPS